MSTNNRSRGQWYRMDLHTHTPGSNDYHQSDISYLDILQQAERRGLNILAFTDHNTVRGYREMMEEIERLRWLKNSGRMNAEEEYRLSEFERLLEKILVLPGFELTAMFGFHVLGIFSPETPVRFLEHLLLDLKIPRDLLDAGETNVGATTDVLTAYAMIRQAGGLVIAAHANSNNGVAMRGFPLGGQTRIAYTQDPNLHCLEVTDLERRGRRTTRRFFDGSKPEYPRAMRCIQGSDSHRIEGDGGKNLGVGERVTEIRLPDLDFTSLYGVLSSNDFALTRPYRGTTAPYDHVLAARQEGASIVQDFHPKMTKRGGFLYAVVADVCAFANTNGGAVYVGVSADPKEKPAGVQNINQSIKALEEEIDRAITPPLDVEVDIQKTEGEQIIRVQVQPGQDVPYAIDGNKIYIRDDEETSMAVRDEIVQLVLRGVSQRGLELTTPEGESVPAATLTAEKDMVEPQETPEGGIEAPRTGVEVVATEKRNDTYSHAVRDLRNGSIVRNVTRESARKLWHYAITELEDRAVDPQRINNWQGEIAILKSYEIGGKRRYDLAQQENGRVRVYFGVTEDGIQDSGHEAWREILGVEDDD